MFSFWKGDFEYIVDVTANSMCSGKLVLYHVPANTHIDIHNFNDVLSLSHVVLDINKSSNVTFNVPFINQLEFIETSKSNGRVGIFVARQITAPDNYSVSLTIMRKPITLECKIIKPLSNIVIEPNHDQDEFLDLIMDDYGLAEDGTGFKGIQLLKDVNL